MTQSDFEKLVQKALLELPKQIREKMDDVAIIVEKKLMRKQENLNNIKSQNLLGLYEGVPQNAWGRGLSMRLPDKITIFQEPIEKAVKSKKEVYQLVKEVVWHEIGHHFGFDEKEIRALEKKLRDKSKIS